ncbi:recombinase family protein [Aureimonas psammosilenae]|uniref:recombinase family protein n=1 Tax=Aureimonas psammosilenae TaxID=2495496 RepID=UPI001260FCC6|nr:recombinase family protein [Aureimonas psammosilenae]
MKVVAYFRQNTDPTLTAGELAIQRHSVAEWLAEKQGTLIGEFTEVEGEGKSRPAFGQARRLATQADAVLLIATTKAIGPRGRFQLSFDFTTPIVRMIDDPAEIERRAWERSKRFVVYLRDLNGCGERAEASLAHQRSAVAAIISPTDHEVIATFIEIENPALDPSPERPALEAAVALCKTHRARLLIGTRDMHETGKPLASLYPDVPSSTAWNEPPRWDTEISAPPNLPTPLALHLGSYSERGLRPLYLVNTTGGELWDITATRSGWTLSFDEETVMKPRAVIITHLANDRGHLIDDHSVFVDGDFVSTWQVAARDGNGQTWSGTAEIPKGDPDNRRLGFRNWAVDPTSSDPSVTPGDT